MASIISEQVERNIADLIISKHHIYTLEETDEFCLYNGGFFHKGTTPLTKIRKFITDEAKDTIIPTRDPNISKQYNLSTSKKNIIVEMIKTETFIPLSEFDKTPSILCLKNGLYNFQGFDNCLLPNPLSKDGSYDTKTKDPLVFGKKDFLTFDQYVNMFKTPYKAFIQIPVDYDPDAECLVIDQFLTDVFGFENVPLIYEMIAYILMPHIKYQKAFILYGPPSTGKTTFITLLWKFLDGLRYFSGLSLQEVGERFQNINLMNKILNTFDDLPDTPIGDTKGFRQIVTNEYLDSEIKHVAEHVKWWNRTKLLFSCNNFPPVRKKEGDSFFRRLVLVACFNTFKDLDLMTQEDIDDPTINPKDHSVIEKICEPAQFNGLINKVIEAWIRLEKRGYFPKEWNNTEYIKNLWMIDTNPVQLFVDECCIVGNAEQTDYNTFYHTLNKFRETHNAKKITKASCTQWLQRISGIEKKRKGAKKKKIEGGDYYYNGIGIKDSTLKKFQVESLQGTLPEDSKINEFLDSYKEGEPLPESKRDYSDDNYYG